MAENLAGTPSVDLLERLERPANLEGVFSQGFLAGLTREQTARRVIEFVSDMERRQNRQSIANALDVALAVITSARMDGHYGAGLVLSGFIVPNETWSWLCDWFGVEDWEDEDKVLTAVRTRIAEFDSIRKEVARLGGALESASAEKFGAEIEADEHKAALQNAEAQIASGLERERGLSEEIARLNVELDRMAFRAVCPSFAAEVEAPAPAVVNSPDDLPETWGEVVEVPKAEVEHPMVQGLYNLVTQPAPADPEPVRMKSDAEVLDEIKATAPLPARKGPPIKPWTLPFSPADAVKVLRLLVAGKSPLEIGKETGLSHSAAASVVGTVGADFIGKLKRKREDDRETEYAIRLERWEARATLHVVQEEPQS